MRSSSKGLFRGAFLFPILAIAVICRAAPIEADLGEGLHYVQLSDASVIAKHTGSQVVDLRFADALEESAEGLAGRLRHAANAGTTLIVLVNAATDPLLRSELAKIQRVRPPILFIGPVTEELYPEIIVNPNIERERRACDALAAGVPPAELITEVLEKARFDEAHLVRTRTNGNLNGNPEGTADPAAPKTPTTDAAPERPRDISLQRAVFLHRALLALGRTPPSA